MFSKILKDTKQRYLVYAALIKYLWLLNVKELQLFAVKDVEDKVSYLSINLVIILLVLMQDWLLKETIEFWWWKCAKTCKLMFTKKDTNSHKWVLVHSVKLQILEILQILKLFLIWWNSEKLCYSKSLLLIKRSY